MANDRGGEGQGQVGTEGLRAIAPDIRPFLTVPPYIASIILLMEDQLRTIIGMFPGLLAFAVVSAQAAPIATRPMQPEIAAAPPIKLVRQGCGWGWHRRGWRDRWGYWHRDGCRPNW
jgi:hypothetical protein